MTADSGRSGHSFPQAPISPALPGYKGSGDNAREGNVSGNPLSLSGAAQDRLLQLPRHHSFLRLHPGLGHFGLPPKGSGHMSTGQLTRGRRTPQGDDKPPLAKAVDKKPGRTQILVTWRRDAQQTKGKREGLSHISSLLSYTRNQASSEALSVLIVRLLHSSATLLGAVTNQRR